MTTEAAPPPPESSAVRLPPSYAPPPCGLVPPAPPSTASAPGAPTDSVNVSPCLPAVLILDPIGEGPGKLLASAPPRLPMIVQSTAQVPAGTTIGFGSADEKVQPDGSAEATPGKPRRAVDNPIVPAASRPAVRRARGGGSTTNSHPRARGAGRVIRSPDVPEPDQRSGRIETRQTQYIAQRH